MKKGNVIILFIFCFCIISNSCSIDKSNNTIADILNKEIKIPLGMYCSLNGEYSNRYELINKKVKIVSYIDSTDCMGCELSILLHWNKFISKLENEDIGVVFIINSKNIEGMNGVLNKLSNNYPVFYDLDGMFFELNEIERNKSLNTFLIDSKHKIRLVGNPVYNNKIGSLYEKEISILLSEIHN